MTAIKAMGNPSNALRDTALIMAGGSGERMRASGVNAAKPLVPALGVPLLERNVHALLRANVRRIIVAVPAGLPEIAAFVRTRLTRLASAARAEIICFVEQTPLGNIGCAGLFRELTTALLVVYADNLTTLDLAAMAEDHHCSGADMTIATHKQPFRMPFGEVVIEGSAVRRYAEKPTYFYNVCSAVSVLGPAALAILPADQPTGLSNLVQRLIDAGRRVRSYPHAAPWIDINDAASLTAAELLIARHQRDFDVWAKDPPERTLLCELAGDQVRFSPRSAGNCTALPDAEANATGDPLMVFDDLDDGENTICRFAISHRVRPGPPHGDDGDWRPVDTVLSDVAVSPITRRVVAFASRFALEGGLS